MKLYRILSSVLSVVGCAAHLFAASERDVLVYTTQFQDWGNVQATEGEPDRRGNGGVKTVNLKTITSETPFAVTMQNMWALPNEQNLTWLSYTDGSGKGTGPCTPGYAMSMAASNKSCFLQTEELKFYVSRVSYVHGGDDITGGYRLLKKSSGDEEWTEVHTGVANPLTGEVVTCAIEESDVCLKWEKVTAEFEQDPFWVEMYGGPHNFGPDRNAFLTELNIYGDDGAPAPKVYYTLTTRTSIEGAGTISVSPAAEKYEPNTLLMLSSTVNEGYNFIRWEDGDGKTLSTNSSFTYTLTANTTIVAVYEAIPTEKKIFVTIVGPGDKACPEAGSLKITPNVSVCEPGTTLHLVATANLGYRFGTLAVYRAEDISGGGFYEGERLALSEYNSSLDFVMPKSNISIKVSFSATALKYTVGSGFSLLSMENGYAAGPDYFYDVDGNGVMEYVKDQTTKTSAYVNGSWVYYTKYHPSVYDIENKVVSWMEKGFYRSLVALDDINRDGKLDLIQRGVDEQGNSTGKFYFTSFETGEVMYSLNASSSELNNWVAMDANADGRTDYFFKEYYATSYSSGWRYNIAYQRADGTFYLREMEIVTDEEEIDNELFSQNGANPVVYTLHFGGASLAKSPARRDVNAAPERVAEFFTEYSHPTAIDINMDGLPDLLNLDNGNALFSLGNGRYYYGSFGGQVTVKDLSGDGIPDYIVYDSKAKTVYLYIYKGNNEFSEMLLMQNKNITDVYCYDFDGDGDVDILLPFDYTTSSQYAFLVFFQNQGNGVFKKKERSLEDAFSFHSCADVDNDGIFEVIAATQRLNAEGHPTTEYYTVKCQKDFSVELSAAPFVSTYNSSTSYATEEPAQPLDTKSNHVFLLDEDNDGRLEFRMYNNGYNSNQHFNGRFTPATLNTCPKKMTTPSFVFDGASGTLRVQWAAGQDDFTSACDLTYALRVGTAPGKGDVWYAHALANGKRLRPGEGNAGSNLYQIINASAWAEGTYYMAVQAIDANGLGGAWSDECTFTLNSPMAEFLTLNPVLSLPDSLDIYLNAPYQKDYSYQFTLGSDASLTDCGNGHWLASFTEPGIRTISLKVTDTQGKAAVFNKEITIYPLQFKASTSHLGFSGLFADWDMNGTLDLVGKVTSGPDIYNTTILKGFFSNDGKGTFKKVGRTYNSDFVPNDRYGVAIDYNMDGLPDYMEHNSIKTVYLNEETFDFTYSAVPYNWLFLIPRLWADFNGDGYWDFYSDPNSGGNNIYLNKGNNQEFEVKKACTKEGERLMAVADFNGDGLSDYVTCDYNKTTYQTTYNLYLNQGNATFAERKAFVYCEKGNYLKLDDLNGDGFIDLLFCSKGNDQKIYIYPGNASLEYNEVLIFDYTYMVRNSISYVHDYDNNGYIDLWVTNSTDIWNNQGILFFYPNWETVFCPIEELGLSSADPENGFFADWNGDGRPDIESYSMATTITNEAPQAPSGVCAVQTAKGVTLKWNAATDKETPAPQLRYNISLKKAGASGEDSYLISPMNGDNDKAAMVPNYPYQKATELTIPLDRFVAGQQYELRVQSIDLWNVHSNASPVYTFTVTDQVNIEAPVTTGTGVQTTCSYTGTTQGTPQWNVDGGSVISSTGNTLTVVWNTAGVKTLSVTVGGVTSSRPVSVVQAPDMNFTLPSLVLANSEVNFTLPAAFANTANQISVTSSAETGEVNMEQSSGNRVLVVAGSSTQKAVTVSRRGTSLDAKLTVNAPDGNYWIEFTCNDPICGKVSCRRSFRVMGQNLTPQIALVTVDAATGKNKITWAQPKDLPAGITFDKVLVYKEDGGTNHFVLLDEVALTAGEYVDKTSDPTVRKNRYRIALKTTEEAISTSSDVHSSVHVMLNRGITANSINIVWTPYEGAIIDQYTLLRGTSPENMQVLTTASGYETSYTDQNVPAGDVYYALQYSNTYSDEWNTLLAPMMRSTTRATNSVEGRSNVVNANQSAVITLASSLRVLALEDELTLQPDKETLHFYTEILPAMASYKQVNWTFTSGADLAKISTGGVLTYCGGGKNGTITLKATTVDGSALSATVSIPVSGFVNGIEEVTPIQAVKVYGQQGTLVIEQAAGCEVTIVDLSGRAVNRLKPATEKETVAVPAGLYIVRVGATACKVLVR